MGTVTTLQSHLKQKKVPEETGLQLVLMSGTLSKDKGEECAFYYQKTYELWHRVWSDTLKELDGIQTLASDQFTRQEIIASLFWQGQCVALTCFRGADLSNPVDQQDSWFTPWSQELMESLGEKYPKGQANSFFTIHPDFRKSKGTAETPFELSLLLTEVVAYVAVQTAVDVTYGVTRNNRSVNKLAYYGGAVPLLENQKHHGVAVDLIAFFPEQTRAAMRGFSKQIEPIWNHKINFLPQALADEEKKHATAA